MIPNVVRGDRMSGLLVYLAGPGRSNEHTEPHLVAGDPAMMAWHDDAELSRDSALAIARHLDRPQRAFNVEVKGGHVWHCSLSLRAEEGQLTDDKWRAIAEQFVDRMGFGTEDDVKAPCRWVAVRHGLSTAGNDHVHLVVDLVREDGTKASIHHDFQRAQDVCRALEVEHGLQPLESAAAGRASRGYDPAEREAEARRRARGRFERARRDGAEERVWGVVPKPERDALIAAELRADQPRFELARRVRGCATASADEAEFVRRMRQHGLLVRARFADGRDDIVTGYSVADRPAVGERPIWYGGGHLARDLALPRLREEWPDTPEGATAAVAEWTAAKRGRRPAARGRELHEVPAELWQSMGRELEELRDRLRQVPVQDRDGWARVARQASGAFAAWSMQTEPTPGPLAATADVLARSAETRRAPARPQRAPLPSASGAALLLIAAARGGQGPAAQMVLLRQLANLAKALHDWHVAAGEARQAFQIEATVRRELATVGARLDGQRRQEDAATLTQQHPEAVAARDNAQRGMMPAPGAARTPLPAQLTPTRPRTSAGQGARPGDSRQGDDQRGR